MQKKIIASLTGKSNMFAKFKSGRLIVGLSLSMALLPSLAHASALEQFKSFVGSTQSAKGEFSQQLVKIGAGKAPESPSTSSGIFHLRPAQASSSGLTRSRTNRSCKPTATSCTSTTRT